MGLKELVLKRLMKEIKTLDEQTGPEYLDPISVVMDLRIAMKHTQRKDLLAMILQHKLRGDAPGEILANVVHDLGGLRSVYKKEPGSKFFVPRSSKYAQRHPLPKLAS